MKGGQHAQQPAGIKWSWRDLVGLAIVSASQAAARSANVFSWPPKGVAASVGFAQTAQSQPVSQRS